MLNFDGRVYPKICVLIDFSFAMMEIDLILAWIGTEAFVWATFHFTPAAWLASADLSNFVILIFYRFSRQEMEKSLTQQQKDLSIRWAWCQKRVNDQNSKSSENSRPTGRTERIKKKFHFQLIVNRECVFN